MHTLPLSRISAFVLVALCLLFSQQQQSKIPAAPAPANPGAQPPNDESMQQPATQPQASEPGQHLPTAVKAPRTPKEEAWRILNTACAADNTSGRATAIRVLGLMLNDAKAIRLAGKALDDDKPEVRSAAAAALGDMKARSSIPKLRAALDDNDPSVALAAAHSLELMHDNSAYEVYYEVLTGQRKAGKGLIASQTSFLTDPKKIAQLGFEEGIGFIPFAGIGWRAIRAIRKARPPMCTQAHALQSPSLSIAFAMHESTSGAKVYIVLLGLLAKKCAVKGAGLHFWRTPFSTRPRGDRQWRKIAIALIDRVVRAIGLITTTPSSCPRHHPSMWSILDRRMFSSGPTLSFHREIRTMCPRSLSGGKN
jgi:HEAT repeat protein